MVRFPQPCARPQASAFHSARGLMAGAGFLVLLAATTATWAASAPSVRSGPYTTGITATSADLEGFVDANGRSTTAWFDFGTTTSFGTRFDATPATVTGTQETRVIATATGLKCATTYVWRAHGRNKLGERKGAARTFTTAACSTAPAGTAPAATTGSANATTSGATLNASVVPGSATATVTFDWGTTTSYGSSLAATPSSLAASTSATSVSASLSGLACGTAYHFRVRASSSAGTVAGGNQTFNTSACPQASAPVATTGGATPSANGAAVSGSVVPGSAQATVSFDWGTTTAYGSSVAAAPSSLPAATTASTVNASLTGLACATQYHYRVRAVSGAGSASGANGTFTTAACSGGGSASLRVSVGGFGHVSGDAAGLSCGSVPEGGSGSSARCYAPSVSGEVTLVATPYNSSFVFAGWSGDAACAGPVCSVPASGAKWVRAKFVPATASANVCTAVGLVGDKSSHPLGGNYPAIAVGQSFVDPNFRTAIRRVTNIRADGRGGTAVKTAYSTISAFNADESYLILYRVGVGHELYNGRTYAFIRKLGDLPTADLEQFYWDTTRPNIIYGASARTLYRYDVDAPAGSRLTALRDFSAQCGTKTLSGGSDPFFSSWDSRLFGMACTTSGVMFGYDPAANTLGATSAATEPRADSSSSPQASPSGRRLFLNTPQSWGTAVRLYDRNMVRGAVLDQGSGHEHASVNMLSNGNDSYLAVQFDAGPSGTGVGTLVQWNLDAAANSSGRIPGRVIVGPATGYPYPPGGTHIGATAFNRTGFTGVSISGTGSGSTVLDNELLYVDTDPSTNPAGSACRVGHHRSNSDSYWAEPHATLSPSGTRIVFGSSWGNSADSAPVDVYVVELPGYRP